jgi:hypothetical protein
VELLSVLSHDRGCRLQPNADAAALIDKGAFGGYAPDNILNAAAPEAIPRLRPPASAPS